MPRETNSEAVRFPASRGHQLSGRLVYPATAVARGWVLLAHCFTCGKELKGYYHLTKALAREGVGSLRFDFTGLGDSGGEFASSDLGTNVDDLRAAAEFLTRSGRQPAALIGHSLGGIAALVAMPSIPSARALVLVGTPAVPDQLLSDVPQAATAEKINAPVELTIGGQHVAIGPGLAPSLRRVDLAAGLAGLNRPLLILQPAADTLVAAEHATALLQMAKEPKTLILLEEADHLLNERTHADKAAAHIARWLSPYLLPA